MRKLKTFTKIATLTHITSVQFTRRVEEILVLLCMSDCEKHLNQLSEFRVSGVSSKRLLHNEVGFTFIRQHRHDELL